MSAYIFNAIEALHGPGTRIVEKMLAGEKHSVHPYSGELRLLESREIVKETPEGDYVVTELGEIAYRGIQRMIKEMEESKLN